MLRLRMFSSLKAFARQVCHCLGWTKGVGLVWFASALNMNVFAADAARYNVRVWQTDEGLPQNSVNAITQTRDGYLWVGTREGLACFDGIKFTLLDEAAASYLKNASISALCVSRDGSLWIASESNGLTRLKGGKFTHFLKADGLPDNQVQCLLEGRDGGLWIGSETGLARFYEDQFTLFPEADLLHNNSIKALHEDGQGILRVATVTGLASVNKDGVPSANNLGIGPVGGVFKSVCVDQSERIWLGTTDGLICLVDGKPASYAANKTVPEKITTVIHEDRVGQLWIGTYGGLTRRIGGALAQNWWLNKSGIDDVINTVYEDRERNLWIGGRDGLYRLSPARFVNVTTQDGLTGNNVVSLLEDRDGAMWFATWGNGVTRLKGGRYTSITASNGLTYDKVLSLEKSRNGNLWVGMDFVGVLNRLPATLSNDFPRPNGIFNSAIRVIHEDKTGAVWVGTGKGLNVIFSNHVASYTTTEGLAGNDITAICENINGQLWIGTDQGLSCWTGNGFTNLTTEPGLSHNRINAIYADAMGEVWIATRGGGLSRYKAGKLTSYTTQEGLFNDDVYEVLEDASGHLWMSCRRGIFRVSRSELDNFDSGNINRINSTSFGREDGLATEQCNGVAKPAGWKSQDGRLWFATIRGAVAVEPNVRVNDLLPAVIVEKIVVDQKVLRANGVRQPDSGTLMIPPGSGRIEIHFTALSLWAAEKNRFKYQLEGLDDEWVDAGHQRVANYPNAGPGTYRFKVIACNNDGVWNESGAELTLRILPHFWQTWWFRAALVLFSILLIAGIYRIRVARLRGLADLRIRIAQDLHDDIGSRLTRVAMVTELADRETPAGVSKSHIQNIARTVRDITRAMDEIVWTINPRNDSLENLANYIFHYAQEYFQDTGVRCRLDLPHDLPDRRVTTEERHNLFMAVKEALNNVLKHAGATEVRIALTRIEKRMVILISDNGRGVSASQADLTGVGMLNMKQRLQIIGGEFKVENNPAGGTAVAMQMPRKWSV